MVTRSKRPQRLVTGYKAEGETRRGNPRTWYFRLECGHLLSMPHGPRASLIAFMFAERVPRRVGCAECAAKRESADGD